MELFEEIQYYFKTTLRTRCRCSKTTQCVNLSSFETRFNDWSARFWINAWAQESSGYAIFNLFRVEKFLKLIEYIKNFWRNFEKLKKVKCKVFHSVLLHISEKMNDYVHWTLKLRHENVQNFIGKKNFIEMWKFLENFFEFEKFPQISKMSDEHVAILNRISRNFLQKLTQNEQIFVNFK